MAGYWLLKSEPSVFSWQALKQFCATRQRARMADHPQLTLVNLPSLQPCQWGLASLPVNRPPPPSMLKGTLKKAHLLAESSLAR